MAIASRRIQKVYPADDTSGDRDRRRGRGRRCRWCGCSRPSSSTTRRSRASSSRSRARRTSSRRWSARTSRPRCRGSSSSRSSPASTRAASAVGCSATTSPAASTRKLDFQANGSGGVHARNWIKAAWERGHARATTAVDLALRSLFAAADEDAGDGRTRPRPADLPNGRDDRQRRLPRARRRHDRRVAPQTVFGGREEGAGL